jgi:hypothetical protein
VYFTYIIVFLCVLCASVVKADVLVVSTPGLLIGQLHDSPRAVGELVVHGVISIREPCNPPRHCMHERDDEESLEWRPAEFLQAPAAFVPSFGVDHADSAGFADFEAGNHLGPDHDPLRIARITPRHFSGR